MGKQRYIEYVIANIKSTVQHVCVCERERERGRERDCIFTAQPRIDHCNLIDRLDGRQVGFLPVSESQSKIRSKGDPTEAGQIRVLWSEASGLEASGQRPVG